jgi:diguanylate cyclase (GGDEF)-like protein/PAS domain S-box-containing protein
MPGVEGRPVAQSAMASGGHMTMGDDQHDDGPESGRARSETVIDLNDPEPRVGELFEQTFEHAPIGIALVALDGRWLRVNRALCRITGYTTEELLARTFQDITHPDDLGPDLERRSMLLGGELGRYELEKRYVCRDGSVVWVRINVSVAHAGDGSPVHFIVHVEDITVRRVSEAELAFAATHDPLTGLGNRALLLDHLDHALADVPRSGRVVAVFYTDLDGFKTVNDRFGHAAGDEVLKAVGAGLQRAFRPVDTITRFGGDEFVVCCPRLPRSTDLGALEHRIHSVVDGVARARTTNGLSASVGFVAVHDTAMNANDVVAAADLAMYDKKRSARARR